MKKYVWCATVVVVSGCGQITSGRDNTIPIRFELAGHIEPLTASPESDGPPRSLEVHELDAAAVAGSDSSEATLVTPDGKMFLERAASRRTRRPTSVAARIVELPADAAHDTGAQQSLRAENISGGGRHVGGEPHELIPSGSWLEGVSLPDGRIPWTSTTAFPARAVVSFTGATPCSGVFIGPRHVLTAAHCLYARGYGYFPPKHVTPGQKGKNAKPPYGTINVAYVIVPNGYKNASTVEDDLKYDYGLIITADSPFSVGWFGFGYGYNGTFIDGRGYPSSIYPCYQSPDPGTGLWDAPWGPCDGHQYWQASNISEYASFWAFSWLDGQRGQSGMPWYQSNIVYLIHHGAHRATNRTVAKRLSSGSFNTICDWIADAPSAYWDHDCY